MLDRNQNTENLLSWLYCESPQIFDQSCDFANCDLSQAISDYCNEHGAVTKARGNSLLFRGALLTDCERVIFETMQEWRDNQPTNP